MYSAETSLRVRYGETDQMGYLYYGNYAQYYEVGRVEAIRSLGLSYKKMEEDLGIMMPVMSLQVRYLRPAKYDEVIKIVTQIRKLPQKTVTFYCDLFNEKEELINSATITLCFVDTKSHQRVDFPQILIDKLKPYFEESF